MQYQNVPECTSRSSNHIKTFNSNRLTDLHHMRVKVFGSRLMSLCYNVTFKWAKLCHGPNSWRIHADCAQQCNECELSQTYVTVVSIAIRTTHKVSMSATNQGHDYFLSINCKINLAPNRSRNTVNSIVCSWWGIINWNSLSPANATPGYW